MRIKVSDLKGAGLDWAVAVCDGYDEGWLRRHPHLNECYAYSTNWALGGPIIDRENISLRSRRPGWQKVTATIHEYPKGKASEEKFVAHGSTPLEAAMRCYVASKLGDVVYVPDELVGQG